MDDSNNTKPIEECLVLLKLISRYLKRGGAFIKDKTELEKKFDDDIDVNLVLETSIMNIKEKTEIL